MKYKKGDIVRIATRINGHTFFIGQLVTIVRIVSNGYIAKPTEVSSYYIEEKEIESTK